MIKVAAPIVFVAFGLILCPSSLLAVYQDCKQKGKSFPAALTQLSFMSLGSFAAYAWLWSPYTIARTQHFILFNLAIGIAFGKMATKIILAHLTKKPFPQYTGLVIPLLAGSLIFNLPAVVPGLNLNVMHQLESVYLWVYLSAAVIGYSNWLYHVINSFCAFLDINCLTIKKSKRKTSVEVEVKSSSDQVYFHLLLLPSYH